MGFYVGSALKSRTCVCLNKNERFKRKSLLGDTRLACLHLNVGENTAWWGEQPCLVCRRLGVLFGAPFFSSADKAAFTPPLSLQVIEMRDYSPVGHLTLPP